MDRVQSTILFLIFFPIDYEEIGELSLTSECLDY